MYYNPSFINILFRRNMLVCAEDNSGFILKSPNDAFNSTEWLIYVNFEIGKF